MKFPQFPFYIPSKSRSEYMITSKALTIMGIKHYVIVEPDQVTAYQKAVDEMKLLTIILPLDMNYKNTYELCDDLGHSQSTGAGPARNFAWDHSIANGFDWHWVMDDNIRSFNRLNKNERVKCENPSFWAAQEDFVLRYKNVGMAGPQYRMFAPDRSALPPFVKNTRIYSCNLIKNDLPFRWRGRHNEDTILSIDILKKGWCTILFNVFLQDKAATQTIKGGNTSEIYHANDSVEKGEKYSKTGTVDKSKMLVKLHGDISRIVHKFGRVHHHVDYRSFKVNRLIKKENIVINQKVDNYGITLREKK
jgi:hypothetical protein|tara:strand:- start:1383 stop:2300 length:918 start_codon:yes stop_codon:yes gene_type:complete